MAKYPTRGQQKLISNYCDNLKDQIALLMKKEDKFFDDNGNLIPNDKYLEMEENAEVQNLISLLKYAQDDFDNTFKKLKEDGTNPETVLKEDDFESKYERLQEYFVLPDIDNLVDDAEDTIKH